MSSAAPRYADDAGSKFAELASVRLLRDVEAKDWDGIERLFPAGSAGTVVGVYQVGYAYEVEFDTPFAAVVTLVDGDLTSDTPS